jgi:hypothetical protein
MPKFRNSKDHLYNPVSGEGSYRFDAIAMTSMLYWPTAIAASSANTTVYDVFAMPQRGSIVKLAICYNTGAAYVSGSDMWNIVMGGGAENAASGAAQALAVNGNSVFAADRAFAASSVSTNYNVDNVVPDQPETWYDAGAMLSLRVVTSSASGTHFAVTSGFAIQVYALIVPVDPKATSISSANPNTDF